MTIFIDAQEEDLNHFAIVTVVKNDLSGLKRSRASLEMQRYKKWLHIIVDGGSTDGTLSYLRKLPKENTLFISEPDNGIYDAMNKGWKLAQDDTFVFYLNARDEMTDPLSLSHANKALKVNPGSNWGCTTHEEAFEDGSGWVCKLVSPPSVPNQLYAFGYRSHQAVVMKKAFIEYLGGFNERYKIAADWDLIVRALLAEAPAVWTKPIAKFELGGMSSNRILDAHLELRALRMKHLELTASKRLLDDLWCAIYLRIFNFQNYWTPFVNIFLPEISKSKFKRIRKARNSKYYFNKVVRFVGLSINIQYSKKRRIQRRIGFPKLPKNHLRQQFIENLREKLGISGYV